MTYMFIVNYDLHILLLERLGPVANSDKYSLLYHENLLQGLFSYSVASV